MPLSFYFVWERHEEQIIKAIGISPAKHLKLIKTKRQDFYYEICLHAVGEGRDSPEEIKLWL